MDLRLAGTMKPFIVSMLLLLPVTAILAKKASEDRGASGRSSKERTTFRTVDKTESPWAHSWMNTLLTLLAWSPQPVLLNDCISGENTDYVLRGVGAAAEA